MIGLALAVMLAAGPIVEYAGDDEALRVTIVCVGPCSVGTCIQYAGEPDPTWALPPIIWRIWQVEPREYRVAAWYKGAWDYGIKAQLAVPRSWPWRVVPCPPFEEMTP